MSAPTSSPQLDVCIVAWRSRNVLPTCLRSLAGRPEVGRVVVVDNASGDGTVELVRTEFSGVHVIANPDNAGFAAGNNQALHVSTAPFVMLLNPDTEVPPGALEVLLRVMAEDPRIGAVAPQLRLRDGSVQRSCRGFPEPGAILFEALGLARLFPRSDMVSRYRLRNWDHRSRRDCDQPMASALLLRRAALDEVGLFDARFPLYFNDVDLCYRLRLAGWRIVFEPAAKVNHYHGHSTWQARPRAILDSHRSLLRFWRLHYRGRTNALTYAAAVALAWLSMWPRAGLARLRAGRE